MGERGERGRRGGGGGGRKRGEAERRLIQLKTLDITTACVPRLVR